MNKDELKKEIIKQKLELYDVGIINKENTMAIINPKILNQIIFIEEKFEDVDEELVFNKQILKSIYPKIKIKDNIYNYKYFIKAFSIAKEFYGYNADDFTIKLSENLCLLNYGDDIAFLISPIKDYENE